MRNILFDALKRIEERSKVTVKLAPQDYELLRKEKNNILSAFDNIEDIKFVSDENLNQGDVIVETDFGKIDETISTQLEFIKEEIIKGESGD